MATEYIETPVRDPVGADVGERLRAIHVRISMEYHVENPKLRRRGDRIYPREDIRVHRTYVVNIGCEALDPETGPDLIAITTARRLRRYLVYEGWPRKTRDLTGDDRPRGSTGT